MLAMILELWERQARWIDELKKGSTFSFVPDFSHRWSGEMYRAVCSGFKMHLWGHL
jgi:hypothetical protein